ncbi:MAG TPA: hypothetical protein VGL56_01590 [Fimbriimonadaceae bacterium]|jgi:hypothetical protein
MRKDGHSAAQLVLIAAARLAEKGHREFSEWDLTVETWLSDQNRFGCRGYEALYPDHKRVMMEIMGKSKKDNPVARGWLKRTRTNHYKITPTGLAQATFFLQSSSVATGHSKALYYDAVAPYIQHRQFRNFQKTRQVPNMWLSVEAYYGITSLDRAHVEGRLRHFEDTLRLAKSQMLNDEDLIRGPVGGGRAITNEDVTDLQDFHEAVLNKFSRQLDMIRKKSPKG